MWGCGLDWSVSLLATLLGCCKCDNGWPCSIKVRDFHDLLSDSYSRRTVFYELGYPSTYLYWKCILTFRGPCIVIYYNKSQQDALFLNFILVTNSTCFGQTSCPSSGVQILYSQQLVFVIQLCCLSASKVTWKYSIVLNQSCTHLNCLIALVSKFYMVEPNIFAPTVWNLPHVTLLSPKILRWLLYCLKICVLLSWTVSALSRLQICTAHLFL